MYCDNLDLIISCLRTDKVDVEDIAQRLETYKIVTSMTGVRNVTVKDRHLAIPVTPTVDFKTLSLSDAISVHINDKGILRALQHGTRWEYSLGKLLQSDLASLAHNSNMGIATLRKLHTLMIDNGWGWRGYVLT